MRSIPMMTTGTFGSVLGVRDLSCWAVVGDVTNRSKPAYRVAEQLTSAGRQVHLVSPYARVVEDEAGRKIYKKLSDIPSYLTVDAVNLIISPRIGLEVLDQMAERGVQYCFLQPGADAPLVLERAAELGMTVQRGCVLVDPMPPLD
mmetsp:Transcript_35965/g.70782  ORF Transcript_35965/g.70782 Transcript_35965/m.70782 type:complete len:146 (+) Transcript_35965:96-533(+)